MQLLGSEDEILVGNAALCLGNCMEVPLVASSLLTTDIVRVLLRLAGGDAQKTAVQLNAGIALGKLCTAEPRCVGRGAPPGRSQRGDTVMGQGPFQAPRAVLSLLLHHLLLLLLLSRPPTPSPLLSPSFFSPLLFQEQGDLVLHFFARGRSVGRMSLRETGKMGWGHHDEAQPPSSTGACAGAGCMASVSSDSMLLWPRLMRWDTRPSSCWKVPAWPPPLPAREQVPSADREGLWPACSCS